MLKGGRENIPIELQNPKPRSGNGEIPFLIGLPVAGDAALYSLPRYTLHLSAALSNNTTGRGIVDQLSARRGRYSQREHLPRGSEDQLESHRRFQSSKFMILPLPMVGF